MARACTPGTRASGKAFARAEIVAAETGKWEKVVRAANLSVE
jgi:hypothetical protein